MDERLLAAFISGDHQSLKSSPIIIKYKGSKPLYKTELASGADIKSRDTVVISPGGRALVSTGLFVEIPPGYEIQVRARSGLALNHGVTLMNGIGTIDADYRGEIKVILFNSGHETFTVEEGMNIAQLVVCPVIRAKYIEAELNETQRANAGFGSTGV